LSSPTPALGCGRCCSPYRPKASRPTIGRHPHCSWSVDRPTAQSSICRASRRSRAICSCAASPSFGRNDSNRASSQPVGDLRLFGDEGSGARGRGPWTAREKRRRPSRWLWLGEWIFQDIASSDLPSLFAKSQKIQDVLRRLLISNEILLIMKQPEDDLHIRPGRIRDKRRGAARPKTFVGQVMRAARKAGHTGKGFGRNGQNSGSRFGRGRSAALALSLRTPSRRVVMKARVVRHRGSRFRSAPLAKHVSYLRRDGVTKDGVDARMFDARSDAVEERAFAERSEADLKEWCNISPHSFECLQYIHADENNLEHDPRATSKHPRVVDGVAGRNANQGAHHDCLPRNQNEISSSKLLPVS